MTVDLEWLVDSGMYYEDLTATLETHRAAPGHGVSVPPWPHSGPAQLSSVPQTPPASAVLEFFYLKNHFHVPVFTALLKTEQTVSISVYLTKPS